MVPGREALFRPCHALIQLARTRQKCVNLPQVEGAAFPFELRSPQAPQEEPMADQPSFEIPSELRDMAEKNVEQARAAYGQFMDFMTQAMGAWAGSPMGAELTGFKAVQDKAVAFAKENAERSFSLASDLARAKDMQEMLTLQSRYVQSQMQSFGIQAQQLSWLMADAMRDMQPKSKG
jgi:hypothetical protein